MNLERKTFELSCRSSRTSTKSSKKEVQEVVGLNCIVFFVQN